MVSNTKNLVIDCGNSGTLARLLCGMLAGYNCEVKIIGDKSLSRRDSLGYETFKVVWC